MTDTCRFVSIAVAAVDIPAAADSKLVGLTHLAAIGLLVAEREGDRWRFSLRHQAIGAGESEALLLAWAERMLPDSGTLIGWQLADAVVKPLLDAGTDGNPEIARALLARLRKLVTAPTVDLALHHGGAAAAPLEQVAAGHGIVTSTMTAADIESAWSFVKRQRLRDHVAAQAIATWQLWLAESNGTAAAATAAFEAWLG